MPTPRPTIYEVAHEAGVSISTVSNVLNRPDRVSDSTRIRVLHVADRLGYIPKVEAVHLARKRMRRIAVFAPFTSYPSFLRRLNGVIAEARTDAVDVSVFDLDSAATSPSPVLAGLPIQGQVDGLIVMGIRIDDTIERRLFDRGLPTVIVDSESTRFPVVTSDDVAGGRLAARTLWELGHRRFGYIVEHQASAYDSQAKRRLSGFRQQLDELGGSQLEVVESSAQLETSRGVARALLGGGERPTAVMAHFDDLALGAALAAKDLGLSVPGDVTIMGYDDGPLAIGADLTTIRQPLEQSGVLASRLLLSMINGAHPPRSITYLDLEVVIRGSSAAPVLAQPASL